MSLTIHTTETMPADVPLPPGLPVNFRGYVLLHNHAIVVSWSIDRDHVAEVKRSHEKRRSIAITGGLAA